MNIKDYTAYFHDGSIIDIKHQGNKIELSMESAEMAEEDMREEFPLSAQDTIKGKLHLEGINRVKENGFLVSKIIKKYDAGQILDFEMNIKMVELKIVWVNYPPHSPIDDFSTIEIEAEKIWWENIPDLYDPYW